MEPMSKATRKKLVIAANSAESGRIEEYYSEDGEERVFGMFTAPVAGMPEKYKSIWDFAALRELAAEEKAEEERRADIDEAAELTDMEDAE